MKMTVSSVREGDERKITVHLTNPGTVASLETKLTLLGQEDARILPAYYSDNYISLLPGETRIIEIQFAASAGSKQAQVALRGWNAVAQTAGVKF